MFVTSTGARQGALFFGGKQPICQTMAKHIKKSDLPHKTCATCAKPFSWRKKWAAVWDEVRYCSERCKRSRPKAGS